jgi:Zn-dependent protease/CBS domain-containing protein
MNDEPHGNSTNGRKHPWSFSLGAVAGIPIRIHFTFLFLLLFLAWIEYNQGGHVVAELAFVLGIFGCVLLHELGHSLMAASFGIKTRDIVLYPIGGISSLSSMGTPHQEFWITAAGPAVNIVLAAITFVLAHATHTWNPLKTLDIENIPILQRLVIANIFLAIFNLIPAFPMDGGRLLRSALAGVIGKEHATRLAATVGQGFAILFGVWGFLHGDLILVFIAIFVFLAAGQENASTHAHSVLTGRKVREGMVDEYQTLHHSDTLGAAADEMIRSSQQDFPIVDGGGNVVGVLTRKGLLTGLASEGREAYVSGSMSREYETIGPDDSLEQAPSKLLAYKGQPVLVFNDGHLVGMITYENLMEYIMVREAAPR